MNAMWTGWRHTDHRLWMACDWLGDGSGCCCCIFGDNLLESECCQQSALGLCVDGSCEPWMHFFLAVAVAVSGDHSSSGRGEEVKRARASQPAWRIPKNAFRGEGRPWPWVGIELFKNRNATDCRPYFYLLFLINFIVNRTFHPSAVHSSPHPQGEYSRCRCCTEALATS